MRGKESTAFSAAYSDGQNVSCFSMPRSLNYEVWSDRMIKIMTSEELPALSDLFYITWGVSSCDGSWRYTPQPAGRTARDIDSESNTEIGYLGEALLLCRIFGLG